MTFMMELQTEKEVFLGVGGGTGGSWMSPA